MAKDARIGVFICRCGGKIDQFIEVEQLEKEATILPQVSAVCVMEFPCSIKGLQDIKKIIGEEKLNRLVIAGCTPRTHQKLFGSLCQEAGLNHFAFEMANIREQCAMVHKENKGSALEKAKALLRMAIAKASHIMPESIREVEITPAAVVIGAGIAGMNAALALSQRGIPVSLVEREREMGGLLRDLYMLYPGFIKASQLLKGLINQVKAQPNINVYLNAEVKNISGYIGNYKINIQSKGKESTLDCGSIIVATGARVFEPEALFNYDKKKVITQLQLEKKLKDNNVDFNDIIMVQCVGCRNEERPHCCRICCLTAVKNAFLIKQKNPEAKITFLFRDLQSDYLDIFSQAKESGINFLRYSPDKLPQVKAGKVEVYDLLSQKKRQITYDLIVLSTPLVPQEGAPELAKKLKIPLDDDGFFPQVQTMLKPEEFISNGIYICGCAHWPAFIDESIFQAKLAASRALFFLSKGKIEFEAPVCNVREDLCRGCATCVEACEFNAAELVEKSDGVFVSTINPALCSGCGTCASLCPTGAIIDNSFTDHQISEILDVLFTSSS